MPPASVKHKRRKHLREGFSLIELLVVIGILTGLAGIVFVFLNPEERIGQALDAQVLKNAEEMTSTLKLHMLDTFEDITDIGEDDPKDICKQGVTPTAEECVNLDKLVVDGYLSAIPIAKGYENDTISGYELYRAGRYVEICPRGQCGGGGGIAAGGSSSGVGSSSAAAGSSDSADSDVCGPSSPIVGMVAYWPLEDGAGDTATENVGGCDGTLMNGGEPGKGAFWTGYPTEYVPSVGSNALHFVTTVSYPWSNTGSVYGVRVPVSSEMNFEVDDKVSWSLWIRDKNLAGVPPDEVIDRVPLVFRRGSDGKGYSLMIREDRVEFTVAENFANSIVTATKDLISPGMYYHILATYDGTQPAGNRVKIYVNGYDEETTTQVQGTVNSIAFPFNEADPDSYLYFGLAHLANEAPAGTDYRYLVGYMDDIAFHNEIISPQLIAQTFSLQKEVVMAASNPDPYSASYVVDGAESMSVADVDGDGDPDALTNGRGPLWFANNGAGIFGPPDVIQPIPVNIPPGLTGGRSFTAADLSPSNGVNLPDALVVSDAQNRVAWFENLGSAQGYFHSVPRVITSVATGARHAVSANFDGDGDIDVVAVGMGNASQNFRNGEVAWYKNDGSNSFTRNVIDSVSSSGAYAVAVADIDADLDQDIFVAAKGHHASNKHGIVWFKNNGAGNFTRQNPLASGTGLNGPTWVAIADIDDDGRTDDVIWASTNGITWRARNNEINGNFTGPQSVTTTPTKQVIPVKIDADNNVDLLVIAQASFQWYRSKGKDGGGNFLGFDPPIVISNENGYFDGNPAISVSDVDCDGDLDFLAVTQRYFRVSWFENRTISGGGGCSAPSSSPGVSSPSSSSVGGQLGFEETHSNTWYPNGDVLAVTQQGTTTYIGGSFDMVGQKNGPSYSYDTATGLQGNVPTVEREYGGNSSLDIVPDGNGGWFVGGNFKSINGQPADQLAHVYANGTVDQTWNPVFSPTSALAYNGIWSLAYDQATQVLYVGGVIDNVSNIGGSPGHRDNLVAFDMSTAGNGNVLPWAPDVYGISNSGQITDIILTDSKIYIAGLIDQVNGASRQKLAAFNKNDGSLINWDPNVNSNIWDVHLDGTTLYIGGSFTSVLGQARNKIAAINTSNDQLLSWAPPVLNAPGGNPEIRAIESDASRIYIGGWFNTVGGQSRGNLAALDKTNGSVVSGWSPSAPGFVFDMVSRSGQLFFGGQFTTVNGQNRSRIASVNISDGSLTSFDTALSYDVDRMRAHGTMIYAMGKFDTVGKARHAMASLDANGNLTAWNPAIKHSSSPAVQDIEIDGSQLYIGGAFDEVSGQTRNNFAAFNFAGSLQPMAANTNNTVVAIASDGASVFLGGFFTTVNGVNRNRLAKVSGADGTVDAGWNPNANNSVHGLLLHGTDLYVGGTFTTIKGVARNKLARVDASGLPHAWNPSPDDDVLAFALNGSTLFIGGEFNTVNDGGVQTRNELAAFDLGNNGALLPWTAENVPSPIVNTLAVHQGRLYVGRYVADGTKLLDAYSVVDGTRANWNPVLGAVTPSHQVHDVAVGNNRLLVGGAFKPISLSYTKDGFIIFNAQ